MSSIRISELRDKLIDIILKVAMAHHDDVSKQDEDRACEAADEIFSFFEKKCLQCQVKMASEEEIEKIVDEWKWGFLDKAPFLIDENETAKELEVTNLKKSDLEYIYRAIGRLAHALVGKIGKIEPKKE